MKLLEQLHVVAKRRRLAPNTIDAYSHWVRRFLLFCARRGGEWKHPVQLGTADVEAFLNDLVLNLRLSASAQNQALSAASAGYTASPAAENASGCSRIFLASTRQTSLSSACDIGKRLLSRSVTAEGISTSFNCVNRSRRSRDSRVSSTNSASSRMAAAWRENLNDS
jgi:hypothetical protein